ncbi:MAG: Quinoprotein glucose dehydrogenase, partial [Candidatus Solibacter sp.]|nr:Quinoprotein glucose dehydrogenase [Candidatus Solibacter sp.]
MTSPVLVLLAACAAFAQVPVEWPVYGGNPESTRYSPLKQIGRSNVARLQVAWTFDTGARGALQTNPIVVNGTLYGNTPDGHVIALNAETGKPVWTFDSK